MVLASLMAVSVVSTSVLGVVMAFRFTDIAKERLGFSAILGFGPDRSFADSAFQKMINGRVMLNC